MYVADLIHQGTLLNSIFLINYSNIKDTYIKNIRCSVVGYSRPTTNMFLINVY